MPEPDELPPTKQEAIEALTKYPNFVLVSVDTDEDNPEKLVMDLESNMDLETIVLCLKLAAKKMQESYAIEEYE